MSGWLTLAGLLTMWPHKQRREAATPGAVELPEWVMVSRRFLQKVLGRQHLIPSLPSLAILCVFAKRVSVDGSTSSQVP